MSGYWHLHYYASKDKKNYQNIDTRQQHSLMKQSKKLKDSTLTQRKGSKPTHTLTTNIVNQKDMKITLIENFSYQ